MAKKKQIECDIYRWQELVDLNIGNQTQVQFTRRVLKLVAPALIKDLRSHQARKLVLTQTRNGIKLERKMT